MFFVNYLPTGQIVSYTGTPGTADASVNDCPAGCSTLSFSQDEIPGFINSNGACMMQVDTTNNVLVYINPVAIPAPIVTS